MMETLTSARFQEHLNTLFRIELPDSPVLELTLTAVEHHSRPPVETVTLTFQGPLHLFAAQNTYPFRHETLGRFDLFLVPVGKNESGFQYQVVINRLG